jgi:DNA-binding IclR family transcriptional regulator
MANSKSGDSILHRIIQIVNVFDSGRSSMSVALIARRTGLPVTTTHRLVKELLVEGLLERDEDKNLRLGVRLWELGSRGSRVLTLREAALPFMEDVHSVVREHTTLGVLDNDEVLYVERLTAGSSAVSIARIAGRIPAHASSSGLVLLAHSVGGAQERILTKTLDRYTNSTITEPLTLRRRLSEIRQTGFASMQGVIVPESSGVAVPIRGQDNTVIAALSVIVPLGMENLNVTVPVLMTAARGISRAMGWRG